MGREKPSLSLAPRLGLLTRGGQEVARGTPKQAERVVSTGVHAPTWGATTPFLYETLSLEPRARNVGLGDSHVFGGPRTGGAGLR